MSRCCRCAAQRRSDAGRWRCLRPAPRRGAPAQPVRRARGRRPRIIDASRRQLRAADPGLMRPRTPIAVRAPHGGRADRLARPRPGMRRRAWRPDARGRSDERLHARARRRLTAPAAVLPAARAAPSASAPCCCLTRRSTRSGASTGAGQAAVAQARAQPACVNRPSPHHLRGRLSGRRRARVPVHLRLRRRARAAPGRRTLGTSARGGRTRCRWLSRWRRWTATPTTPTMSFPRWAAVPDQDGPDRRTHLLPLPRSHRPARRPALATSGR